MRLNLGCGHRPMEGFTNVDFEKNERSKPDLVHDLSTALPFDDESADEIHAYHLFEHFYRYDVDRIIKDWARVLRPNGKMVLEMPCLDSVLHIFDHFLKKQEEIPARFTMWALYGDPKYKNPGMVHKWCYSQAELRHIMESVGLTVSFHEPKTHFPVRDMRAEGIKCTAS